MIIIGLVGCAGSGKDTAYQLIKLFINKEAERLAFADKLKDIADNMLEIADFDRVARDNDRKTKEEIRPLLVWLGEYARKKDCDYWIKKLLPDLEYLKKAKCPMVIFTDVRYPNEAEFILGNGGSLICIDSPAEPANDKELHSIGKILRVYDESPDFYSVYNKKESKKEFLEILTPIIQKIIKNNSTETG